VKENIEKEHKYLQFFLLFPLGIVIISRLLLSDREIANIQWFDIFILFIIAFTIFQIIRVYKIKTIGSNDILYIGFTFALSISFMALFNLMDLDFFSRTYGNDGYSVYSIIAIIIGFLLLPLYYYIVVFLFSERDVEIIDNKLYGPTSRWNEYVKGEKREIDKYEIIEIFPKIKLTQKGNNPFKVPEIVTVKTSQIAFRTKDDNIYGYNILSKCVSEIELVNLMGEKRYRNIFKSNPTLLEYEKQAYHHPMKNWKLIPDVPLIIFAIASLIVLFISFSLSTLLLETDLPMGSPLIIIFLSSYPGLIWCFKRRPRGVFIKFSLIRMNEIGEDLPNGMEIRGSNIIQKKN